MTRAQTLLTGANSAFTSAQTTTITAVDANGNPATYRSGNMNDVLGGGYPSTFLLGTGGSVVNTGVASVKIGSTTFSAGAGDTYANSAFLLTTGNFASPTSEITAETAGVAFRLIGNQAARNTSGYHAIGVDLVKVGDTPGIYTGSGSAVGNATVDFFVTLKLTPTNNSRVSDAAAQVFVMGTSGAAQNSTATTAWNSNSSSWVQLGPTIPNGGTLGNSTYTTNGQTETAYAVNRTSSSSEDASLTFGGTFVAINNALKTIYGNSTAVQWNQGDVVRFVPVGQVGSTVDFMGINSSQGGTGTLPFATNGTAAITDAYVTGNNFALSRHSIDGYSFGVVPEPSTWSSAAAMLVAGGVLKLRSRRRSLR
jgi:hypothetical protein